MGCGASNTATATSGVRNQNPNNTPAGRSQSSTNQQNNVPRIVHKPLSQPKNYRHGSPITQGDINNQRNEFWSTRTEGNAHMWQAIRSAAEGLLTQDLPLANAILEASNISTPNGSLEVCYDERGFQYKIPHYCFSDPVELTTTGIVLTNNNTNTNNNMGVTNSSTPNNSSRLATVSEPAVPGSGTTIKLRVRINPGDHNLTVFIDPIFNLLQLKQQIVRESNKQLPQVNISAERQRIIFMGKELDNALKVKDAKFDDSKVVQVFLRPEPKK